MKITQKILSGYEIDFYCCLKNFFKQNTRDIQHHNFKKSQACRSVPCLLMNESNALVKLAVTSAHKTR